MMMEIAAAIVELDALKPKQQQKEFKNTQKDLKSKDPVVKLAAARKFKDARYITEGKCLPPFLLSIVPKKVYYDLTFCNLHGN
jgi:hypothetical protein